MDKREAGVAAAWGEAAGAAMSHPSAWGVALAAWVGGALSLAMCGLPFLVTGPLIAWGVARSALDTLDGTVEFDTLFTGLDHPGHALPGMLMLGGLLALAWAPGAGLAAAAGFGLYAAGAGVGLSAATGSTLVLAWSAGVVFRFAFAPFLFVEHAPHGLSVTDALGASWDHTARAPVDTALLGLTALFAVGVGVALCGIGGIVGSLLATLATAAAYRQRVPSSDPGGADRVSGDLPLHPSAGPA